MSLTTSTRQDVGAWLLATGIAGLTTGIFTTAIVLGSPSPSDVGAVKPDVPPFEPNPLPREWRWERGSIPFEPGFRQSHD
jgi:hypothetical protein